MPRLTRNRDRPAKSAMLEGMLFACGCCFLAWGCVSPVEGLWPPARDTSTHQIYVSVDTWHAMIAFPLPTQHSELSTQQSYEEWGYAERAWYVEGRMGITGILRALLWPTEGVVEVGHYARVWAERTPQPPAELFAFRVSGEGLERMREQLRASIAHDEPILTVDQARFYPAVRSYHLFYTCHQYAAAVLRQAGLPIAPWWAVARTALAIQLRRAQRLAQDQSFAEKEAESR